MVDLEALTESFQKLHHQTPRLFSAPGRVNLIGEHTDYNEGFVLPMAVNRRTVVAAARNQTERIRVLSLDLDETGEFDLNAERSTGAPHWMNYVEGVARVLKDQGVSVSGANLAITSDVPRGSGLSSSAALEMSVGWALVSLAGVELDLIQLALAAQQAEHVYAGTKCGLMDQLASAFGRKDHALLIDCRSLERTLIELNLPGTAIVVCDTNVRHKLAASAYNERRAECERGVEILRQRLPGIRSLRDVSVEDLEKYQSLLPEPVASRCRHVVTENERTLKAAEALRKSDIAQFGRLMTFSHQSLRDDYEVSCRELDIMVEHAMQHEGVAGARMTGGGFGGCTVNLVQRNLLESFCDFVARGYEERTGTKASIYVVEAEDGMREIKS